MDESFAPDETGGIADASRGRLVKDAGMKMLHGEA